MFAGHTKRWTSDRQTHRGVHRVALQLKRKKGKITLFIWSTQLSWQLMCNASGQCDCAHSSELTHNNS